MKCLVDFFHALFNSSHCKSSLSVHSEHMLVVTIFYYYELLYGNNSLKRSIIFILLYSHRLGLQILRTVVHVLE